MFQKPGHDNRGFTLMELIIALVILSVMFMFAIPQFPAASKGDRTMMHKLLAQVTFLKEVSASRKILYTLNVDQNAGKIWITSGEKTDKEKLPESITLEDTQIVDVLFRMEREIEGDESPGVRFFPGGYSDWAAIHFQDDDGRAFSVVVEPFMSEASIVEGFYDFNE